MQTAPTDSAGLLDAAEWDRQVEVVVQALDAFGAVGDDRASSTDQRPMWLAKSLEPP